MRMANAIGAADTELDLLDQLFASESEDDDNVQPVTESFTPGESEQGPESTRPLKRAHTLCSQAKADTSRQPSLPTPLSKIADTIHMHGDALISAVACLLEHLALHAMQAAWRGEWSVDIPCALHTSSAAVTSDASEAATFMHAKATELPGSQHTDHALTAPACASQAFDPWNGHATSLHRCDARQAQPLMAATAAKLTTETGWRTVKEAALACCAAAGSAQLSSGDARLMQTLRVQDLLHACTPCGAAVQRCMHGMLMQPPCAYTQPSPQPHSSSGCSCSSLHPRSTEQTAKGSSIHTDDQGAEPMGPGPWVSHACACAHAPARMLRAPHASCVPPGLVLIKHWLSAQQQVRGRRPYSVGYRLCNKAAACKEKRAKEKSAGAFWASLVDGAV